MMLVAAKTTFVKGPMKDQFPISRGTDNMTTNALGLPLISDNCSAWTLALLRVRLTPLARRGLVVADVEVRALPAGPSARQELLAGLGVLGRSRLHLD